jgi:Na+/H+-dicarboxylate symporter/ABC-type amino acid transport substrate-binding protein
MSQNTEVDQEKNEARSPIRIPRPTLGGLILIALVLGIATGLFFGELVAPLEQVGIAFIRLLQITVIPYISVALITGLGRLEYSEVKRLAARGGAVLAVLWIIAIVILFVLPLSFPDWPSRSLFQKSSLDPVQAPDFLQLYIPSNPFFSLANGIVPAVVVFSIMIGLALTGMKKKSTLIEPLSVLGEALSKMTSFVARLAPIGVFALMANTTGTMDFEDLARLQVYIVVIILMLTILGLWFLPGLVSCVTPLRRREVIQRLRTPLITAFATGSSLVVLPILADICKKLISEHQDKASEEEDTGQESDSIEMLAEAPGDEDSDLPEETDELEKIDDSTSSVDVLIPTFYSFPTAGALMSLGFVLFAGWYIGLPVSVEDDPLLLFAGIASLFGGTALAIPFTLDLAELPQDLFQVFISIDVIISRFTTFVSVMQYATIALIASFALANMLHFNWWRIAGLIAGGVLLVSLALTGVSAFYTNIVVVPYTKDELLKGQQNLRKTAPYIVFRDESEPNELHSITGSRSLTEIRSSGVLRACYGSGNYPLSFFNDEGELVGFDIEMALRFSDRLGLAVEFLPLQSADDLPSGRCDAFFNSQGMVLHRTEVVAYTDPFDTITLSFIVPSQRRDEFMTWSSVRAQGNINVATPIFQSLEHEMSKRLPNAHPTRLGSLEEQYQYFESGGEGADAFLDAAEEGAAWTVLYPSFTVVVPRPVLRLPVAYSVSPDNLSLLQAMNDWLKIERATGDIEEIYDYWIQGDTTHTKPPRWSIVRDVLGWVD